MFIVEEDSNSVSLEHQRGCLTKKSPFEETSRFGMNNLYFLAS